MNTIIKNENKKRGRKKKETTDVIKIPVLSEYITTNYTDIHNQFIIEDHPNTIIEDVFNEMNNINEDKPHVPKKRGRKPKGGNLITKQTEMNVIQNMVANVILHLKCSSNDLIEYNTQLNKLIIDPLVYNPNIPPNILTYSNKSSYFNYNEMNNINYNTDLTTSYINNGDTGDTGDNGDNIDIPYHNTDTKPQIIETENNNVSIEYNEHELTQHNVGLNYAYVETQKTTPTYLHNNNNIEDKQDYEDRVNIKDINIKLKKLKINFYKNTLTDKKSACFWCTYDYDNFTCYIPKYEIDGNIHGYGSFCRPECAVAYLMKENIDDSTKFERYHLLNQVYSKIYNYSKNIKPSPNPYYLLDKFYGNLSIQEYRKLLKTEHLLLVIDKPLTRILPELHEDNEDIMLNIYGNMKTPPQSTNNSCIYKVKRQSERQIGPSKSSIILENFGGN